MIDIVIPIGYCYFPENTNNIIPDSGELRYCLRSIEKHLKGVRNVFIIGCNIPAWVDNVGQIICGDKSGLENKEWNIYNKIRVVCGVEEISDTFLFMNDDHYLLQDYNAAEMPYYYEGTINDHLQKRPSTYLKSVANTAAVIGGESLYYDIHTPILYNKNEFRRVMTYDWKIEYGYVIKSLYCHGAKVTPTAGEDIKISCVEDRARLSARLTGKQYFSTSDNCFGTSLTAMMNEFYPEKSKYEK